MTEITCTVGDTTVSVTTPDIATVQVGYLVSVLRVRLLSLQSQRSATQAGRRYRDSHRQRDCRHHTVRIDRHTS